MYDIGDIILNSMGGTGLVPCDGSLYLSAAYPDAAVVLGEVLGANGAAPSGYFYVPDIPEQAPYVKPHIKIEDVK